MFQLNEARAVSTNLTLSFSRVSAFNICCLNGARQLKKSHLYSPAGGPNNLRLVSSLCVYIRVACF